MATYDLNVEKFIQDISQRPAIWNRNYHCSKTFVEETWDDLEQIHKIPKQTLKAKWKGLRDNFRVEYKRIPRNENNELLFEPSEYQSKWSHYKALVFLVDHMRSRAPKPDAQTPSQSQTQQQSTTSEQYYYDTTTLTNYDGDQQSGTTQSAQTAQSGADLKPSIIGISSDNLSVPVSLPTLSLQTISGPVQAVVAPSGTIVASAKKRRLDSTGMLIETTTHNRAYDDDFHFLMSLHPFMMELNASQKLKVRTRIQNLMLKELYNGETLDDSNN